MKKFKIPTKPTTVNKCIRFPEDIVEKVEKAIENKNCTFSAFILAATQEALNTVEKEMKRNGIN